MKKLTLFLALTALLILTGCSSKAATEEAERDLYYETKEIKKTMLTIMNDATDDIEDSALVFLISGNKEYLKRIDELREKVNNLTTPKHLQGQVGVYVESVNAILDGMTSLMEGDASKMDKENYTKLTLAEEKLFDMFKVYEPKEK